MLEYLLLFVTAFAASTILPMSSEAVLAAMAVSGSADRVLLFLVATAGNTLGAVVNWALGRYAGSWIRGRMAHQRTRFERASRWFRRWGVWSLLLSWLPVFGDPLTLVAGLLRTPFVPFLLLVLIGKAARYAMVLIVFA